MLKSKGPKKTGPVFNNWSVTKAIIGSVAFDF